VIRSATVFVAQAFRPEGVPGGGRMAASGKRIADVRIAGAREGVTPEGVSYRASSSCKSFAKCRRADIFIFWIHRSANRQGGIWSAGACSRLYGGQSGAQTMTGAVRLQSKKRRQAAALQDVSAPVWYTASEVCG